MDIDWIDEVALDNGVQFTIRQGKFMHFRAALFAISGLVVCGLVLNWGPEALKGFAGVLMFFFGIGGLVMLAKSVFPLLFIRKDAAFRISRDTLTIERGVPKARSLEGKALEFQHIKGPQADFAERNFDYKAHVSINYRGERITLAAYLTNDQASYLLDRLGMAMGRTQSEPVHA